MNCNEDMNIDIIESDGINICGGHKEFKLCSYCLRKVKKAKLLLGNMYTQIDGQYKYVESCSNFLYRLEYIRSKENR